MAEVHDVGECVGGAGADVVLIVIGIAGSNSPAAVVGPNLVIHRERSWSLVQLTVYLPHLFTGGSRSSVLKSGRRSAQD